MILIKHTSNLLRVPCKCAYTVIHDYAVQSMVQIRGNYYAFRDSA